MTRWEVTQVEEIVSVEYCGLRFFFVEISEKLSGMNVVKILRKFLGNFR